MANITFGISTRLNDSVFGLSQAPIRSLIEDRAEAQEQNSVLPYLFNTEKTNKYMDKLTSMTGMDGFQPTGPENGAYPVDGMQESYSKILEQMEWKDSFSISQVAVEDSVALDLRKKPVAFTTAYYRTRERFGANLFGGAIQLANDVTIGGHTFNCQAADGQKLFSKVQPSKVSGGNQSNYFADAFSPDALAAMETKMQNFKGDNDNLLAVAPDTILIPNDYKLKKAVFAAIGADQDPATANNGYNFLFGRWRVIVWAELNNYITGGTSPWIMLDSGYNEMYDGAIWLDRIALEVNSDIDAGTGSNVWRGRSRFTAGFNDWRFAAVGGVASGTALISG